MAVLGIDIGGSGIKGAPVNVETGEFIQPRLRCPTPDPATPKRVALVVKEIVDHFGWKEPIGCGFPAVVRNGVAYTAANIHRKWIGTDISALFEAQTGCRSVIVNDADAAGLAEMKFGAGKEYQNGIVLMVTLGTGIGSAIFVNGNLLPNTEFGHLQIRGKDAEWRASDGAREAKHLTWKAWAKRVNEFLTTMENLIWPDLIVIGGGVSKEHERFFPYFTVEAKVVPAMLLNNAGIVGAALAV